MGIEGTLRLGRDRGHKVFRPAARGLDVLGSRFEDLFEVGGDVGEGALEGDDDLPPLEKYAMHCMKIPNIFVVLPLLIPFFGLRVLCF